MGNVNITDRISTTKPSVPDRNVRNRQHKGEYGYFHKYRQSKLIMCIIFIAMIEFIIITSLLMYGTTKTVLIVFAILLALPLAKFFIAFILCVGFKRVSPEEHERISEAAALQQGRVIYDVGISQYEGLRFYKSICIKNGKIYAFVMDKAFKEKEKEYKSWIEKAVKTTKYEYPITIFEDVDKYADKIKTTSEPNDRNRTIDKHIMEVLLDFSL